jgi:glycosyltransferase involved in cell wall biosynthesis
MNRGGAELRTIEIMRHIDRAKYRMDYCVLSGAKGDLDAEIELLGGQIHYLKLQWTHFAKQFAAVIAGCGYSIIHSHVHDFSGAILWLAARTGVSKRIAHFRSSTDGKKGTPLRIVQRFILRRLIDRYATNILAVSKATMETAWSVNWRQDPRCHIIYNGIEQDVCGTSGDSKAVRSQLGVPYEARCLVHVGNFVRPKNHLRVIDIFYEYMKIRNDSYLVLLG